MCLPTIIRESFQMDCKIYDCFCFFNEDMLLKIRLETLWEYVDVFVIVESVYTISGKPKDLNFNIENFRKYQSKIRYLVVDHYPFDLNDPWRNERYQRNYIARGLHDAQDRDLIMVSDLDEIPRPEMIASFDGKRYLRGDFEQYYYAYYLNNRCSSNGSPLLWYGSKITTYKNFIQFFSCAESLRNYKSSGMLRAVKRYLFKKLKVQIIQNGGWHFSWMAGIDKIIQKLESFAHQEYNKPEFKDPESIKAKIAAGFDILNPKVTCQAQVVDRQFPKYLIGHKQALKDWLLPVKDNSPE